MTITIFNDNNFPKSFLVIMRFGIIEGEAIGEEKYCSWKIQQIILFYYFLSLLQRIYQITFLQGNIWRDGEETFVAN